MKQPYYDFEIIEVTVKEKLKVSWQAGDQAAKEYAMSLAKSAGIIPIIGADSRHGCYRVEKV